MKELKEFSVHREYVVCDVVTVTACSKKEARQIADSEREHGTVPDYLFPIRKKTWLAAVS